MRRVETVPAALPKGLPGATGIVIDGFHHLLLRLDEWLFRLALGQRLGCGRAQRQTKNQGQPHPNRTQDKQCRCHIQLRKSSSIERAFGNFASSNRGLAKAPGPVKLRPPPNRAWQNPFEEVLRNPGFRAPSRNAGFKAPVSVSNQGNPTADPATHGTCLSGGAYVCRTNWRKNSDVSPSDISR